MSHKYDCNDDSSSSFKTWGRLSTSNLAMTSPGLQYLCWRLFCFRGCGSKFCMAWIPIPAGKLEELMPSVLQRTIQAPWPGGFQVDLANGRYWWKTGGQNKWVFLLLFASYEGFICVCIFQLLLLNPSLCVLSSMKWPCHSSNSHPMASVSGCGDGVAFWSY